MSKLLSITDVQFTGREHWRPINDPQLTAMHCKAQALMFGGGSGGGKTDLLVADAAQEYESPNLRAILIRRAYTEMPQIISRCRDLYSQMSATQRDGGKEWNWPWGAQVRLGYVDSTGDIGRYQGNPFTYLGLDESTYLKEKSFRDILPWLTSTDPSLFCRARLCTNPGQIGADWHMGLFLRGKCPVHFPEESVVPGQVYRGSKWMDGVPTNLTTAFIPSLATDNPLYGQQKIDMLRSQTAENAEKLLLGCWCQLTGAYYKFLRHHYKLPYASVNEQWWMRHIISVDYGFGGSSAAAGLYCGTEATNEYPEGRLSKVGELVEQEMGSEDFAHLIGEAFVEPLVGGRRRQIEYAVFDPATDAHTGTGRSNFDIMRQVLQDKYGISCIKAAKDRIGCFQNLYRMLKTGPIDKPEEWRPGQLVITDTCPITFSSLQTRMHDPKKPGDIIKVAGDPKDDLLDETSYAANTYFSASEKPKEVAHREKMNTYREAGMDEHSLNIYELKFWKEANKPAPPVVIGRRRTTISRH